MADQDTGKGLEYTNQGLPLGWVHTTLGEIRVDKGATINPCKMPDTIFELYSVPSYDTGRPEVVSGCEIGSNKQIVAQDTVLLCKINPRINRRWVVGSHSPCQKIASTEWIPFFKVEGIVPEYLAYYMKINDFRDFLARNASGVGGSLMRVNPGTLAAYPFPLAPTSEQERIVEAIEMHFTRLDAGVDGLRQVQSKLKRYRSAVLKAAVEGTLTEAWRAEHPDVEPASVLLQRILQERRSAWGQAELAKFARTGRTPPKGWQAKYKEPAAPSTTNLPQLPKSWCWARAEQLCDFITKGTTPAADKLHSALGDVPFIKVYNLTNRGVLDFSINPTFISKATHRGELSRSRVLPNDILMNIVGPPLGKVSIVPNFYPEWNVNQAIAIFRPMPSYNGKYLSLSLLSEDVLTWAKRRAKATAGQFNLTLEICRDLPLPLPPSSEQEQIVDEVERRLSVVAETEAQIEAELKRAERLRQSILKQAFAGKLVPQDTEDEPAGALLERIRSQRRVGADTTGRPEKAVQLRLV